MYSNFLNNYFLKEFTSYFLDDSLNYSLIPVEARTTSSLENYNSYINRILGEKEEINWLNFLTFIKDEVDRWQQKVGIIKVKLIDIIKSQNKLFKKSKKSNVVKSKNNINNSGRLVKNAEVFESDEHKLKMKNWLIYENNSCRYDCFLTLYAFIIKPFISK